MLCIARSAVAVLLVAVRSVLASGPNCKISILNDFKVTSQSAKPESMY